MTIRVLLADDQPLIRSGLGVLIDSAADMGVVAEAGTGAEAVRLAQEHQPDVIVMDIRMPVMDGIEATRHVVTGSAPSRVLVLSTFDDDESVYAALRAGASGFLVKDMALDDILNAIRVVAAGDALLAPSVTRRLIDHFADHSSSRGPTPANRSSAGLTDRERQVLTLVGRGRSNAEIAADLFISPATAKAHVARLLAKLESRDRIQLVIVAYEMGLVSPG
ncbi:response regulator [Winogradskya humida]|uniref:DNA-binding response regulator n=1 Tax=Winogradskya humida TaxID=113566 RepID=A0ABQ3ZX55_9ACTN|nr:response regulator transcription factor [Actinoplanes humidus]GIE23018.1 DNA-binding response regulator [Actinoplanes humidus]